MHRMQLIEIHDQGWFPAFLRDAVTDDLQFALNAVNAYQAIADRLQKALERSGARRIVDLCSGAGGPWFRFYRQLEQAERPPVEICLTDKYPNARAFGRAGAASESGIYFSAQPVDATKVSADLNGFRTLFTSFHHFRPPEARAILQDAVDQGQGIGIFEVPSRRALTILLVFLMPLAALLAAPLLRPFRWSRLLWTYLIPVIPLVLFFDGIVSCLRAYSPGELRELVAGLSANRYEWEIGEARGGLLRLPVTYLIGCLNQAPQAQDEIAALAAPRS